ncbi:Bacteriophage Mu P (fragment) [uncultured Desulfobacterium sp.]|uniref:Bacteriophage Mu P n=1 Tax=uncultured Desulfobacterium sp. TaxID=201089 RepID=A0A445MWL5_9BACT
MNDVTLKINNLEYGGWKEVHISRGIDQIAGGFDLTVSDRWPGQNTVRPIRPGDSCTVAIDGVTVITGYVDDVSPYFEDQQHDLHIAGRDRTGDLVDCSAVFGSGEWRNRTILQIASDLCGPFGISVSADVDCGAAFSKWNIQESETVFECIERAARIRGLLLTPDGTGGLLITRASTERISTALVEGENIKSGSGDFSWRDRYSAYTVKGQNAGDDYTTTAQNAGPKGEAQDPAVTRYRPLIIIAEDQADSAKLNHPRL